MVAGDDSSQLSDYCFGICEALNTKVQAENADNLKESVRMAVEDLGRCADWHLGWPRPCSQ